MSSKRFKKAEKRLLGLWMLALDAMSDEARAASSEPYPEDSEFACHWWNQIYEESNGNAWFWAMSVRDNDKSFV